MLHCLAVALRSFLYFFFFLSGPFFGLMRRTCGALSCLSQKTFAFVFVHDEATAAFAFAFHLPRCRAAMATCVEQWDLLRLYQCERV